jgi:hypothetical protein
MSSETPAKKPPAGAGEENAPIVIDLGKKKSGRVKKLRKGRGPLMDDIIDSIAKLRADDTISKEAQPVIVVVREKKKKRKGMPFSLL